MKRITSILLAPAVLAGCASSAPAQRRRAASPPAPGASPWEEFVSKDGGFSAMMPAGPKLSRQDVDTPSGKTPNFIHMAITEAGAYGVGYGDFPRYSETPEFVGKVLDGAPAPSTKASRRSSSARSSCRRLTRAAPARTCRRG